MPQQRAPVADRLPAGELDCLEKSLLEAILGVGMVAQQPAGSRPDERAMPVDDQFPVGHFQAPDLSRGSQ